METYYKYAERQADSFVNWAEIGKNLTDMLQKEFQIREQKKAAIDQATRESLKELSNQPTGQHEGLNAWSLKYADEAREAILLQDRLLKKGILKLKDYTIMRQNLNDGTDELYSAIKGYQEIFKTNFLKKIQDTKFDYFDSFARAKDIAKNVGTYLTTVVQESTGLEGKTLTIEDALAKPATQNFIRQKIKADLSNPYNVTSILTEDLVEDKAYNPYVSNISGLKGNVIEWVFDGQSNLPIANVTDEQMKAAEDYMYGMIVAQLPYKEIQARYNKPQPSSDGGGGDRSSGNTIQQIYSDYSSALNRIGLSNYTFSNKMSTTIDNIRNILSQVPGGFDLSVEPGTEDGIVNIKKGDAIVKTFNVKGIDSATQGKYVNEFKGILSNLAEPSELAIWTKRSGSGGTGGINYSDL